MTSVLVTLLVSFSAKSVTDGQGCFTHITYTILLFKKNITLPGGNTFDIIYLVTSFITSTICIKL